MMRGKLLTASAALALALGACTDTKNTNEVSTASPTPAAQAAESPAVATPAESVTPTPESTPMPEPPASDEARAAVARVYKGAVTPDEREGWAVVGDFNGDGSEDLVARVRPAPGRMEEINDDLANWLISDPQKVRRPDPRKFDPHQGVQKLDPPAERPRVAAGDSLLAVIHGFKERGWRSPDASQTYLLRDASGTDLRAQSRRDAKITTFGQNPPRLMGDVIRETLNGRPGLLYWNGATYGWFNWSNDEASPLGKPRRGER